MQQCLPVGYTLTPAGRQTDLGDLPLAAAISPDGQWLAVSNNGQDAQSLQLVNAATGTVSQTLSYPAPKALFVGLAFAPDGKTLYASGGGNEVIRRYRVDAGVLTEQAPIPLPTSNPADVKINPFPSGIALTPDGQRLLVADQQADAFSVVELASGAVHTVAAGHKPYGVVSSPDGHSAYVTNEGANTVSVMDLTGSQQPRSVLRLHDGRHVIHRGTPADRCAAGGLDCAGETQ